jgi:hypothetical protein
MEEKKRRRYRSSSGDKDKVNGDHGEAFPENFSEQYKKRQGEETMDEDVEGDPSLVYKSRPREEL